MGPVPQQAILEWKQKVLDESTRLQKTLNEAKLRRQRHHASLEEVALAQELEVEKSISQLLAVYAEIERQGQVIRRRQEEMQEVKNREERQLAKLERAAVVYEATTQRVKEVCGRNTFARNQCCCSKSTNYF